MPTDGPDDERHMSSGADEAETSSESGDGISEEAPSEEIPRHTKPFRAWGAAQERASGPSVWERFVSWLRGLFARKPQRAERFALSGESVVEYTEEARPLARQSFDDLDAPWADPYPVQERRSSRPSAERPSVEDFETTWDGSYDAEEVVAEEQPEARAEDPSLPQEPVRRSSPADADALWDVPMVSETSAPAPEAFDAAELEQVWSPEAEAPEVEPAAEAEPEAFEPETPKPGFFARLFGRKPKAPPMPIADQEAAAASDWATDIAEAEANHPSYVEPADADFADDPAAAAVPADDDFADDSPAATAPAASDFADEVTPSTTDDIEVEVEVDMDGDTDVEAASSVEDEPAVPVEEAPAPAPEKRPSFIGRLFGRKTPKATPSLEHSAADSAALAELLGPIAPIDETPTELMAAAPPEVEEVTYVEDVTVVEDVVADEEITVVSETLSVSFDSADAIEDAVEADLLPEPEVIPEPEPPKKPGFFSSLLKRVSRSQFIPKAALPEPEVEDLPVMELAAAEEVVELESVPEPEAAPVEEPAPDLAAQWGPPAEPEPVVEIDSLFEAPASESAPEPDVSRFAPPPSPEPELESTQPFPAFRDARDDFAETADDSADSGRPTEQVPIPEFDENQKTDEFQAVPDGAVAEAAAAATTAVPVGFWGRLFGKKGITTGEAEAAAAALAAEEKLPFVLAKFRTFYNEIIRDKHQKSDVISGFATAIVSAAPAEMADPEFAAQLLSKRLSEMLELQAAESNWTGGDAAKYYLEAQYAMVALADETFATIEWPGRSSWHKYMLEPKMYGTRGADIEFFKRIDKLLKDNPDPPKGARDLARVYLLVIASGFRGKFRQPNVKRPLAEYRRRLYEFSHRVDPLELYARDRRLFPAAVEHTLASRAVGRFTSRQKWIAAVLVLAVMYLALSQYAWVRLSADLKDVMSRIETIDANPGRTP